MPAPLRDVPREAIDLIKSFEGIPDGDKSTVNIDAYLCPAGIWTIGWGHAIVDNAAQLKGPGNMARARALYPGGITREQAEALLCGDLIPRAAALSSVLKVELDDAEFGALVALVFNIGMGNLGASTLLRLLNAGDKAGAAQQFLAWDKARVNGVLQSLAGLTRRRRAERALFLGEDWQAVAAAPATRGAKVALAVLPVPEAPADQRSVAPALPAKDQLTAAKKQAVKKRAVKRTVARKTVATTAATRNAAAKKVPAKKVPAKKAGAKAGAAKSPGRTTITTRPPTRTKRRPKPRAAR
jgi:lysozyme